LRIESQLALQYAYGVQVGRAVAGPDRAVVVAGEANGQAWVKP
jgi:hypothetical protein